MANVTVEPHIVEVAETDQFTGEPYVKLLDMQQDVITIGKKRVGYAGRHAGASVAIIEEMPETYLGKVARAMDARDGGQYPARYITNLNKLQRASDFTTYDDEPSDT